MAPPRFRRFHTSKSPPRNNRKAFREASCEPPAFHGREERPEREERPDREQHRLEERYSHHRSRPGPRHRSRSRNRDMLSRKHQRTRSRDQADHPDKRMARASGERFVVERDFSERRRSLSFERIQSPEDRYQTGGRFSPPPSDYPGNHYEEPQFEQPRSEFPVWHQPEQLNEHDGVSGFGGLQNSMPHEMMMEGQEFDGHAGYSSQRDEFGHGRDAVENPGLNFVDHSDRAGPSDRPTETPLIPEFNPETTKLSSYEWLKLIDDVSKERHWKKDEKRYIMTSRLAGFARHWYLTTGISCKTLSELRGAFYKAFPTEFGYVTLLQKMLARVKEDNESTSTYFLHKVALLNACEIYGQKAVSCIIGGFPKSNMRFLAKKQACKDPDELYNFLSSLPENAPNKAKDDKKKGKATDCYNCKETGHVFANCPQLKQNDMKHPLPQHTTNRNGVMKGSLARKPIYPKYFVHVNINGMVTKGYVDQSSETTTIREEDCLNLKLTVKKQYKVVRGFSGSPVSSIGFVEVPIGVDRAMANAKLYVVPDHIQEIPVVVGQSFTEQAHVVIMRGGDKIRFYQRMDNGETNFDF